MDSKEVLETFGISKNFGIVLLIQSIIVIIGCFFAIQNAWYMNLQGDILSTFKCIVNLLFFLVLLFYSFYAYRKNEGYFKWVLYLYVLFALVSLYKCVVLGVPILIVGGIISLILVIYLIYALNDYSKAKIAVLLLVLVELIMWVVMLSKSAANLNMALLWIINLIPCVSIALTYFARYNDKGFKILL